MVDRPVIAMITKGTTVEMEGERLTDGTRRAVAERVLERLEDRHTVEGKKLILRAVIQRQARLIASYLRGEEKYRPWVGGW